MKRAVLYLRVSTIEQTTANQERELREVASRMGCEIVHVYKDHGISGAKGREKRPGFDRMCRDAAQRKFDVVVAWSVDRRGTEAAARILGLTLHVLKARSEREIDVAFESPQPLHVGGLLISPDALFVSQIERLAALTLNIGSPQSPRFAISLRQAV
jgi:hypothetical protein